MRTNHWLRRTAALLLTAALCTGAFAQAPIVIKFPHDLAPTTPKGMGAERFKKLAEERLPGRVRVEVYPSGSLMDDQTSLEALAFGEIQMIAISLSKLDRLTKRFQIFDLPFLFGNEREADQVLDGKAGDYFTAKLTGVGLVNLAWWENGFRNTTNSKRAIVRVEDFDGVKMRVMQNPIYIDTFKALGSNAVPMAFSEVYSALETKTVDGQENPFANIENQKYYEVQKYLTLTRHAYSPLVVLLSKKTWDTMSAQEQAAMKECAAVGRDEERRVNREQAVSSVANLKSKGMIVNDISPAEMQRIRDRTRSVYEQHGKAIGDEALNLVFGELKRIRGN